MKKLIAVVLLSLCIACAPGVSLSPWSTTPQSIVGTYAGTGLNEEQKPYPLEVRITEKGDSFWLEFYDQGQLMAVGMGLREGDVLSVIFQTASGAIGLSSYKIDEDTLIGVWKFPGVEGTGSERLRRTEKLSVPQVPTAPPQHSHPEPSAPGIRL